MEDGKVIEEKSSVDLFSQPEKELTKDFIRTATHIDQALETILNHPVLSHLEDNEELIEFSYIGNQTAEPIISELYSKYQVKTNILYGNIEIIQDVPIGHLIVTLAGVKKQREEALSYLEKKEIKVNRLLENKTSNQVTLVEGGIS